MRADHLIDHIYHHYLAQQDGMPSQAEVGIDGDRFIQQVGIFSVSFKHIREKIQFSHGEIRRWKGYIVLFRNIFIQNIEYLLFDED